MVSFRVSSFGNFNPEFWLDRIKEIDFMVLKFGKKGSYD
jgi:hypothetical protein